MPASDIKIGCVAESVRVRIKICPSIRIPSAPHHQHRPVGAVPKTGLHKARWNPPPGLGHGIGSFTLSIGGGGADAKGPMADGRAAFDTPLDPPQASAPSRRMVPLDPIPCQAWPLLYGSGQSLLAQILTRVRFCTMRRAGADSRGAWAYLRVMPIAKRAAEGVGRARRSPDAHRQTLDRHLRPLSCRDPFWPIHPTPTPCMQRHVCSFWRPLAPKADGAEPH